MTKPTAAQLTLINQKALVPLTEDQVYTFTAKVIGTKLIEKYMMKLRRTFSVNSPSKPKQV
jgi:hypothetical protein